MKTRILRLLLGLILCLSLSFCDFGRKVDFNTEVRPILNAKCLSCHGGVKQSGGFSLLFEEDALAPTESGKPAIIPGKPGRSELVRRIKHHDPELRMPFEKDPLTEVEIDLISRWIKQGAKWQDHWAYLKPQEQQRPTLSAEAEQYVKNEIDPFIVEKVITAGMQPAAEADCGTLIRRLSLDLIGLPPQQDWIDDYCKDPSEENYQRIVQQLLDSPHYGERWASLWMDLARYADTKGFEKDSHREIWAYRDWLIKAFNQDLPYDQFTIEQLAGDLLPSPARSQYIATAFHRNTMTNDEGGTDDEEFRTAAVIDRVNTTWQVFMGTSFGCVQCHGHPYDPFRQKEYYQFYDFLNQTADGDNFAETPKLKFFEAEDSAKIEEVKAWVSRFASEEKAASTAYYDQLIQFAEPKVHPYMMDSLTNGALLDNKWLQLYKDGFVRLPAIHLDDKEEILVNFGWVRQAGKLEFRLDDLNGPLICSIELTKEMRGYTPVTLDKAVAKGKHRIFIKYIPLKDDLSGFAINWLLFTKGFPGKAQTDFQAKQQTFIDLLNRRPESVPVMVEFNDEFRRKTHVFERGSWKDHGEQVSAAVPAVLHAYPEDEDKDRIGLAKWIVHPDNPLTARVAVNRLWEQLFGRGIVETLEDFGTMGMPPSHPELLDYLALRFQDDHRWSMKAMLTEMVSSGTYRQSSLIDSIKQQIDPQNRLLARASRVRLNAEQVRDQALAASGLLSKKMYGKSVMPPQPDGIWQVVYSNAKWQISEGEDRYRRALYTYWRRTSPYPSFLTFDSPNRDVCSARRIATNTPLQALTTLNDPVYMEAAIHLAKIVSEEKPATERISNVFERALLAKPSTKVLEELTAVYQSSLDFYSKKQEEQEKLFAEIAFELDCEEQACAQLAALSIVANTVMNLDGFLVKN